MYGGLNRDTSHIHRPAHLSNRIITQEELEGLESVLRLTERVADQVGSYKTILLAWGDSIEIFLLVEKSSEKDPDELTHTCTCKVKVKTDF